MQCVTVQCAVSAVNTINSSKRQYFLLEYAGVLSALLHSYQLAVAFDYIECTYAVEAQQRSAVLLI
jgi:hypothetical protein